MTISKINPDSCEGSDDNVNVDSFPQKIKSIIATLRVVVDQIDSDFKQARQLILEIARQLDEGRLCDRGLISIKIKEILEDKIRAGKITERWISKCLPQEYKTEYAKDKRELSSLSKKKPIPVSGTVSAMQKEQGKEQVDLAEKPRPKQEVAVRASGQKEVVEPTHPPEENALYAENVELKQTVSRLTTFTKADEILLT
jgi:hypothetical protein